MPHFLGRDASLSPGCDDCKDPPEWPIMSLTQPILQRWHPLYRVEYALRDSGYGLKKAKCSAPLSSLRHLSQPRHKALGSRNDVVSKSKPIVAVADDGRTVERRMVRPFSTQGIISLKQCKSSDAAVRGGSIVRGADYMPRTAEHATRDKRTRAVRRNFGGEAAEPLKVKTGR